MVWRQSTSLTLSGRPGKIHAARPGADHAGPRLACPLYRLTRSKTVAHRSSRRLGKERMVFGVPLPKSSRLATGFFLGLVVLLIVGCSGTDPANSLEPAGPVGRME